jgi:hypothetical protein
MQQDRRQVIRLGGAALLGAIAGCSGGTGGETTSYTFESAGVYEYYCSIHGQGRMCGVVLVGGATKPGPLPCE